MKMCKEELMTKDLVNDQLIRLSFVIYNAILVLIVDYLQSCLHGERVYFQNKLNDGRLLRTRYV